MVGQKSLNVALYLRKTVFEKIMPAICKIVGFRFGKTGTPLIIEFLGEAEVITSPKNKNRYLQLFKMA